MLLVVGKRGVFPVAVAKKDAPCGRVKEACSLWLGQRSMLLVVGAKRHISCGWGK